MYRIIVSPAFDRRGNLLHGRSEARLGGRLVCVSREPLLATSRILIAEGADSETPIAMRHAGADFDALKSTVGQAAALTVEEGEKVGPRFVRWRPFSGSTVEAPVRFSGAPLPDTEQPAERFQQGGAG